MRIVRIEDRSHWSTQWIPITIPRPTTFLWSDGGHTVNALCRVNITGKGALLGDLWVNEKFRGARLCGTKVSHMFLKRVVQKVWDQGANEISLKVRNDNAPAIKLYQGCGFEHIRTHGKWLTFRRHKRV